MNFFEKEVEFQDFSFSMITFAIIRIFGKEVQFLKIPWLELSFKPIKKKTLSFEWKATFNFSKIFWQIKELRSMHVLIF
mgnify:CR=1 FL=1